MAAGARSCVDCGVCAATVTDEGAAVCDRCFDRRVAAWTGHAELPDPPPDEQIVGPDGSDLPAGLLDLDDIDDEDDEEFLRQWDEAEQDAAALIREALPQVVAAGPPREALHTAAARIRTGVGARAWPYRQIAAAAGWHRAPPDDDIELWLAAAGALVAMREESGMGAEIESALIALEHGDWLGAVVGLVRAGVGGRAEAADLVRYVNTVEEVDGVIDPDEAPLIEGAFELVLPVWEAVGALEENRRLTPIGWWGLPRALARAWKNDFDNPSAR
jgi:hypothetical protein